MAKIHAFRLEIETEAIKLGITEQLDEVMVILGYKYPKEYDDMFQAVAMGWEPKTTNYVDLLVIYNNVYAVISTVVKLKLDLDSRRKRGEGDTLDNLIRAGELSDILIEILTTEYTGKWFDQSNIPKDWISLQVYGPNFTRPCKGALSVNSKEIFIVPRPIEKLVKDILSSLPNDIAYNNRGNVYSKQGNFAQAISEYTKAIEINPGLAEAYNNRGLTYVEQGNLPQAVSDYNKAIEINPNLADVYANRGLVYARQSNFSQAVSDFTKAIEINPNFAEAYINRGAAYDDQGNFAQAISDYNKAIEINPNFAEAYYNRGNTYKKQSNFSQAIFDYTKAIEINPNHADAYNNRGVAYFYGQKDFTKAWEDVHKAESLGYKVNAKFIEALRKVSGRDK